MCGVATHMCSHASAGLGKERWKENKDTCENHHTVVVVALQGLFTMFEVNS